MLHAFVDGAANKRAERDEYGRYKLVFPFDLSGRKEGIKVSNAASRDPGWSGWLNTAAAAVSSDGTAVVDALSKRRTRTRRRCSSG